MSNNLPNTPKKVELTKIVIYSILGLMLAALIFFLVKSLLDQKRNTEEQAKSFKTQMKELKFELKAVEQQYHRMTQKRDSLQNWVDYYHPMRAIIYNAKLRDRVLEVSNFKPGDVAKFKVDSTSAVIVEIKVGGNDLTYYVNYLVKNRKGQLVEVSPYELFKPYRVDYVFRNAFFWFKTHTEKPHFGVFSFGFRYFLIACFSNEHRL